jgi:hypothetical protein
VALFLVSFVRQLPTPAARERAEHLRSIISQLNDASPQLSDFRMALGDLCRCVSVAEGLAELRRNYPLLSLPRLSPERLESTHSLAARLAADEDTIARLQEQEDRYRRALDFATAEDGRLAAQ